MAIIKRDFAKYRATSSAYKQRETLLFKTKQGTIGVNLQDALYGDVDYLAAGTDNAMGTDAAKYMIYINVIEAFRISELSQPF